MAGIVTGPDADLASKLVAAFGGAEELDVEKRGSATQNSSKDAPMPQRMMVNRIEWKWPDVGVLVVTFLCPNYRLGKRYG